MYVIKLLKSMNPKYTSYIHSFVDVADSALQNPASYKSLAEFSSNLHKKANQLVSRALIDHAIDTVELHKELFELQKKYVHTFSTTHNLDW